MDLKKFVEKGQDAQTSVNKILSEAEIAMIRRGNKPVSEQERIGRAIAIADHQADEVPPADAPIDEILEAIDKGVAALRKYPNSADLQYCVGYLEGFRELLTGRAASPTPLRVACTCGADAANVAIGNHFGDCPLR
jgi:hypothetical protein